MARTPLLRTLRRFAQDQLQARDRAIPVSALREERSLASVSPTRRQLLTGTAAGLAAMVFPQSVFANNAGTRIAVVGAGIAGMTCALNLQDHGLTSTVYEASGRIGGRMFSNNANYWQHNQVSEWCGELIDTAHSTVRKLAHRFGLHLDNVLNAQATGTSDTFFFDGARYSIADIDADFAQILSQLETDAESFPTLFDTGTPAGRALDAMSVSDWISSRVPGGRASRLGQLLETAYVIEYGAEAGDQSALNLVYLLGFQPKPTGLSIFGESDETFHIRGGNQQLPQAIAASLPQGAIALGHRLLKIKRRADQSYALTFAHAGQTKVVNADVVVLTLPFAVLANLDYSQAGFDPLKKVAITQQGRGRNGKLQLQFHNRPWVGGGSNGNTFTDTGYQATWEVTRGQSGPGGILVDFTGAQVTLQSGVQVPYAHAANTQVRADAHRFLSQLEPVFPGVTPLWNQKATQSLPYLDDNTLLSYSYYRVGQYQTFAGYERKAQGNVYFAGEHTSTEYQGFMEGGASEGKAAAKRILKALHRTWVEAA